MTNSRSKGQRGERLLADVLQEHGWPLARRSGQTDGRQCADVVGGPDGIHLEVKFAERLNVRDAYAQANFDAPAQDTPIVAWKKKRQPWLAVLSLDDLLALLRKSELAPGEVCSATDLREIVEEGQAYWDF